MSKKIHQFSTSQVAKRLKAYERTFAEDEPVALYLEAWRALETCRVLAEKNEALRAEVADYEQRGMGKLDGYEVPVGKSNVYAMHCSYCRGTSNEEDRCRACHETHVEYYVYLEPVGEKGGGR